MSKQTFTSKYTEALNRFNKNGTLMSVPAEDEHEEMMTPPPVKNFFYEVESEQPCTAPAGWKRFSDVFGMAPPSGNDRMGPVYEAKDFPAEMHPFIPKINEHYYLEAGNVEALWHAHIDNDNVWLWGQSGTGKSSLEEQFAARIGQPFLRFNGREDVESSALFGQLTVEGGESGGTIWKDGLLTEGVKYGARVLMDEATAIPATIWMGVQWLAEKDGKLMLTDKPATAGERLVEPDPRFRMTYADNTRGQGDDTGQFNGTGVMNTATLNRVGLTLEVKFLEFSQELALLISKYGDRVHNELLQDTLRLADLLRKAMREDQLSLSFSLRSIDSMLTKAYNYRTMPAGDAMLRAFQEGYANLLPNDDEYSAALNFFTMVFDSYEGS